MMTTLPRRRFARLLLAFAFLSLAPVALSTTSCRAPVAEAAGPQTKRLGQPFISIDNEALIARIALACQNNAITNDAQWTTFVQTRFDATNASGLSAGTRTFLIEFFTQLIKIE
jgi:hypothetical protein